tara:strand:+ start:1299 stop:2060 length:762 start_codon:yes stop_codon:yes gene_type:complete
MNIKGLSVFAIFCLIIVFIIDFSSFKIPELIDGTAKRAETLIYTLCISYIASYIFYFLNVYLKEKRERDSILPLIANNVISIIVNNQSIIKALKKLPINSSLNDIPSLEEFKELLKKVDPNQKAPMFYKDKTWIYLFQNRRESTLKTIEKIFISGEHVDTKLRAILLQIQSSLYLKEDYAFNSYSYKKETLDDYSLVFHKYFLLIQELRDFYDKNLKSYYEKSLPNKVHVLIPVGDDKFKIETQYRKKKKQSL